VGWLPACIVRTSSRTGDQARLWSRQGKDLTAQFPDVAAAALDQLPDGCVVDGELVALDDAGRLSFDLLQRRLVTAPAKARRLVAEHPASFMAFDLLAVAGVDIRSQRWTTRRGRLEALTGWVPPLQLSPVTYDVDEAREWYEVLPAAMGVEGLVAKGRATRYVPGRREWLKVNSVGVAAVRLASEVRSARWSDPAQEIVRERQLSCTAWTLPQGRQATNLAVAEVWP
jgi:ATP-dependent DNA ligase